MMNNFFRMSLLFIFLPFHAVEKHRKKMNNVSAEYDRGGRLSEASVFFEHHRESTRGGQVNGYPFWSFLHPQGIKVNKNEQTQFKNNRLGKVNSFFYNILEIL